MPNDNPTEPKENNGFLHNLSQKISNKIKPVRDFFNNLSFISPIPEEAPKKFQTINNISNIAMKGGAIIAGACFFLGVLTPLIIPLGLPLISGLFSALIPVLPILFGVAAGVAALAAGVYCVNKVIVNNKLKNSEEEYSEIPLVRNPREGLLNQILNSSEANRANLAGIEIVSENNDRSTHDNSLSPKSPRSRSSEPNL